MWPDFEQMVECEKGYFKCIGPVIGTAVHDMVS